MRSYVPSFVACLGLIVFAIFQPTAHAQRSQSRASVSPPAAVATQDAVYIADPPQQVVGGTIRDWSAAPSGRYLLVVQEETGAEVQNLPEGRSQFFSDTTRNRTTRNLVVYDARRNRARNIWQLRRDERFASVNIYSVGWFGTTNTAIIRVSTGHIVPDTNAKNGTRIEYDSYLLVVDVATGQARRVQSGPIDLVAHPSPTQPIAVVRVEKAGQEQTIWFGFRILKADGTVSEPVMFPPRPEDTETGGFGWNKEGTGFVLGTFSTKVISEDKKTYVTTYSLLNPNTQKLTPIPAPAPNSLDQPARDPKDLPLALRTTTATLTEQETRAALAPVWLESNDVNTTKSEMRFRRALLTPDADAAVLLSDNSAVLYQKFGALYATPLRKVDKSAYLAARREAEKKIVIANANEIASALSFYQFENNGNYPAAGEDLAKILQRVRRNPIVLENIITGKNGFTFLLGGRTKTDITEPKTTILGYLAGPGGRAVLYVYGGVRWEDTKEDAP